MKRYFISIFFIALLGQIQAQTTPLDSLYKALYNNDLHDSIKLKIYLDLTWEYASINPDSGIYYGNLAINLAQKLKDVKNEAYANRYISSNFRNAGNYTDAIKHLEKSLYLFQSINFEHGIMGCYNQMGVIFINQGLYDKAEEYFKKFYDYGKKTDNLIMQSIGLSNLGIIMQSTKRYNEAIAEYKKAIEIDNILNDPISAAGSYINIGSSYLALYKVYKKYTDLEKGIKSLNIAKDLYQKNNYEYGMAKAYSSMAAFYSLSNDIKNAEKHLLNAERIYKNIGNQEGLLEVLKELAHLYNQSQNHEQASKYFQFIIDVKDSIYSENVTGKFAEMEAKYQNVQKQKEIEVHKLQLDKQEIELERRKYIEYSMIIGILMLSVLGGVIYIRYREKQKANTILSLQKAEIERKNYEILDSIQYAKRIQTAILPPDKLVESYMQDSFVLYMPKDIVSGDFYWMHPTDNNLLFAAVDCTGHGVPGAFMSIVGYNQLNKMVAELKLTQPGEILTNLNKYVADSLHQEQYTDVKDGMDISLCLLDKKNMRLEYAGANNPLYIIRNGKLIETKADKMAIGSYYFRDEKFYTNHVFELQKGDCVYLFTDGYADQFGGDRGKKYTYKRLREILLQIHEHSMDKQKQELIANFERWRNSIEQIDDVCIIGLKI